MPPRRSKATDTAPKKTRGWQYIASNETTPQPEVRTTAPSARELRARKRGEQEAKDSPTVVSPTADSPTVNSPTVITIDSSDNDEPSTIPPTLPPSGQEENPILILSDPEDSDKTDETDEGETTQLHYPGYAMEDIPPRRPNLQEWSMRSASSANPLSTDQSIGKLPISRLHGNFGRATNKGKYSTNTSATRRPLPTLRPAPSPRMSSADLLPLEIHRIDNEYHRTNASTVRRPLHSLLLRHRTRDQISSEGVLPINIYRLEPPPPQLPSSSTGTNNQHEPTRSWVESARRFWYLPNMEREQRLTIDNYKQWNCWSCGGDIPGMPKVEDRHAVNSRIMSKEYIDSMNLFSQYGDHLCGKPDCTQHRLNFIAARGGSTQINCCNTEGCLATCTLVNDNNDNQRPDRGFKVIEQGNPTTIHHCCSEHCRVSVALELADTERQAEEKRQKENYRLSRALDHRFDEYSGRNHFADPPVTTASSVAASSTGSVVMSRLAINPDAPGHTSAESLLERDQPSQVHQASSSHPSGWTPVNDQRV